MQPTHFYALTMLAAGIGIPVLAALNAQLGTRLGSPVAAAVVLFCVALVTSLVVLMLTGPRPILALASTPRYLMLAGLLVAFYILSITFIAPHFGVGNAVFFVLLGQLVSAALIDHFGLFGARISPVSLTRVGGIALMAAGVFLTQKT
ncbi:DMT family transporter [Lacimonas salitolerans]|uniref:DMT family transporter n=1 Tax=Lacimonas salitolerans TaxID=1323750 RepID=A0ABW4EG63_9RHOB